MISFILSLSSGLVDTWQSGWVRERKRDAWEDGGRGRGEGCIRKEKKKRRKWDPFLFLFIHFFLIAGFGEVHEVRKIKYYLSALILLVNNIY